MKTKVPKVGETVYLIVIEKDNEKHLIECECVALGGLLYMDLKNKETDEVTSFWFKDAKDDIAWSNFLGKVVNIDFSETVYCFCTEDNCPNHIKDILINYKTEEIFEKERIRKEYEDVEQRVSQVEQLLENVKKYNFEYHDLKRGDRVILTNLINNFSCIKRVIYVNEYNVCFGTENQEEWTNTEPLCLRFVEKEKTDSTDYYKLYRQQANYQDCDVEYYCYQKVND